MRHLPVLTALTLLLSACAGGGGQDEVCDRGYFRDGVGTTCLPAGWEPQSEELLIASGVPEEAIIVFQKEQAVAGQFPTIIVTRERLGSGVDTEAYSRASIRSVTLLPSYDEIDVREVEGSSGTFTLHVFTAQPLAGQPVRRFYQVSAVSPEGIGYTFTGLTPLAVDRALEREVLDVLRNITFKGPEEEDSAVP